MDEHGLSPNQQLTIRILDIIFLSIVAIAGTYLISMSVYRLVKELRCKHIDLFKVFSFWNLIPFIIFIMAQRTGTILGDDAKRMAKVWKFLDILYIHSGIFFILCQILLFVIIIHVSKYKQMNYGISYSTIRLQVNFIEKVWFYTLLLFYVVVIMLALTSDVIYFGYQCKHDYFYLDLTDEPTKCRISTTIDDIQIYINYTIIISVWFSQTFLAFYFKKVMLKGLNYYYSKNKAAINRLTISNLVFYSFFFAYVICSWIFKFGFNGRRTQPITADLYFKGVIAYYATLLPGTVALFFSAYFNLSNIDFKACIFWLLYGYNKTGHFEEASLFIVRRNMFWLSRDKRLSIKDISSSEGSENLPTKTLPSSTEVDEEFLPFLEDMEEPDSSFMRNLLVQKPSNWDG